jgi:hypothetical protein
MEEAPSCSVRHTRLRAHPGYACNPTKSRLHSKLSLTHHHFNVPLASSAATALVTPSMARRPLMISGAGPENAMISANKVCQFNINFLTEVILTLKSRVFIMGGKPASPGGAMRSISALTETVASCPLLATLSHCGKALAG